MTRSDSLGTFRSALQGLVHELYFKSSHFAGLKGHSPRSLHDADTKRYEHALPDELLGEHDPFTMLLVERASRLPGRDPAVLVDAWQRAESTLNARMRVVLGVLGSSLSPSFVELLTGEAVELPPLHVTPGRNPIGGKRSDGLFGQPDIVLLGSTAAITIEMKVRGGGAKASYDAVQHFKYLRLAEALRSTLGLRQVYHVLMAPLASGRIVQGADRWLQHPVEHGMSMLLRQEGFRDCLPAGRQSEMDALGGLSWLGTLSSAMPSRFVELAAVLDAVDEEEVDPVVRPVLRAQVAALRTYGLSPASLNPGSA